MLKTKEEIEDWLNEYRIINYTINNDLIVDVDGCVNLSYENLTEIPVQFNKVNGYFFCNNNKLISLVGSPKEVNGWFGCSCNPLTSLKGAPKEVHGWFYCDNNKLTSLKGAPKEVKSSFYCHNNSLTSLEHLPDIHGELVCDTDLHDTREYKVYLIGKQLREMV